MYWTQDIRPWRWSLMVHCTGSMKATGSFPYQQRCGDRSTWTGNTPDQKDDLLPPSPLPVPPCSCHTRINLIATVTTEVYLTCSNISLILPGLHPRTAAFPDVRMPFSVAPSPNN